jgi:hypothetical protein
MQMVLEISDFPGQYEAEPAFKVDINLKLGNVPISKPIV